MFVQLVHYYSFGANFENNRFTSVLIFDKFKSLVFVQIECYFRKWALKITLLDIVLSIFYVVTKKKKLFFRFSLKIVLLAWTQILIGPYFSMLPDQFDAFKLESRTYLHNYWSNVKISDKVLNNSISSQVERDVKKKNVHVLDLANLLIKMFRKTPTIVCFYWHKCCQSWCMD